MAHATEENGETYSLRFSSFYVTYLYAHIIWTLPLEGFQNCSNNSCQCLCNDFAGFKYQAFDFISFRLLIVADFCELRHTRSGNAWLETSRTAIQPNPTCLVSHSQNTIQYNVETSWIAPPFRGALIKLSSKKHRESCK